MNLPHASAWRIPQEPHWLLPAQAHISSWRKTSPSSPGCSQKRTVHVPGSRAGSHLQSHCHPPPLPGVTTGFFNFWGTFWGCFRGHIYKSWASLKKVCPGFCSPEAKCCHLALKDMDKDSGKRQRNTKLSSLLEMSTEICVEKVNFLSNGKVLMPKFWEGFLRETSRAAQPSGEVRGSSRVRDKICATKPP